MRIWIACLFVCTIAWPAAAQPRVRLEVKVESWLDPTPFDAIREFTTKLNEASIEVTEDVDAPVVHILYEETAGPGIWPKLVPATNIVLHLRVDDSTGNQFQSMRNVRPNLNPKNFPSAAEWRVRAIDDFRQHESFRLLGHMVGAVLGVESSFRPLLSAQEPDSLVASMLFHKVVWSPTNDDLFVRGFTVLRVDHRSVATIAQDFLQKNLAAIQWVASSAPVVTPLLAILFLEDYGEPSATKVLTGLTPHLLFGTAARKALTAVEGRHQVTRP
jgi:hypothetical protein